MMKICTALNASAVQDKEHSSAIPDTAVFFLLL